MWFFEFSSTNESFESDNYNLSLVFNQLFSYDLRALFKNKLF